MVLGGDFNDIMEHEENKGRRRRLDLSFRIFNSFITDMEMEELSSVGSMFTWANNKEGNGFVKEKIDRFFVASSWLISHPKAKVLHKEKQSSDHKLIILMADPEVSKTKIRFCFD